jgi:hypothetical protein
VGFTGLLGIGLPSLFAHWSQAAELASNRRKPKSVIIVFLTGAPSLIVVFDLKPDGRATLTCLT